MKTFSKPKERVLRFLIASLSALSQVEDLFTKKSQELNLIEFMFNIIKNSVTPSDLAFSANLFLLRNCNGEDLINSQSSYEAFFFIGRFCLYATEWKIFLEKNRPQIFIKTLKSLYEEREDLNFDSANIEVGEKPKSDEKDFKESIFSYALFSFNILCKDLVRCEFFFTFRYI